MNWQRRHWIGAGAALLVSAGTGNLLALPPKVRLLVADNDTPGARNSYKSFLAALAKRFANFESRFEMQFLPVRPEVNARLSEELSAAIVTFRPDVIFASNPVLAKRCAALNTGKPIIFFSTIDPVISGLTDSLTRPSKGMTGFTLGSRISLKRREMLLRLAPRCKVMGLLSSNMQVEEGQHASTDSLEALPGVDERKFACDTVAQLEDLLKSAPARAIDAWDIEYTMLPYRYAEETVHHFNQLRRPVMYPRMKHIYMGGMAAYAPRIDESDDVWASQLASLLAGVSIDNIPIVQATRYSFGLNLKACHRVGVMPPKSLIKIADVVIE